MGVTEARVWPHPVAIKSVLAKLELKETNPGAQFFSGVVRIKQGAYETILGAGGAEPMLPGPQPATPPAEHHVSVSVAQAPVDGALVFETVEKLKQAEQLPNSLSEYDTRAEFIDKYLEALGYTEPR